MLYETERLHVRKLTPDDHEVMFEVYSNPKGMLWVGDGKPLDMDGCVKWVERTLNNYEKYGYGMSAIVLKETSNVVGFCGIVHPKGRTFPEIKYALLERYWGQGIATECVGPMLAYGAREFGLEEIMASIAIQNVASRHILERCGMTLIETRPHPDGTTTQFFALNPDTKAP